MNSRMKTPLSPRFSILVPVYNAEKYLQRSVDSVLAQTEADFELILVDDGSTDHSGELCDGCQQQDARIRAFHQKNEGQLSARLHALREAQGAYLVFLDADDRLKPCALETIDSAIRLADADMVIYRYESVEPQKKGREEEKTLRRPRILHGCAEVCRLALMDIYYNSLCIKAVRRELASGLDYSRFFDLRFGEDLVQSVDMYTNVETAVCVDNVLYEYCDNPNSISKQQFGEDYRVNFAVREYVLGFLRREDVFSAAEMEAYRGYCQKLFVRQILNIARMRTSMRRRTELYRTIKSEGYYRDFLRPVGQTDWHTGLVLRLFRLNLYPAIVWVDCLYSLSQQHLRQTKSGTRREKT